LVYVSIIFGLCRKLKQINAGLQKFNNLEVRLAKNNSKFFFELFETLKNEEKKKKKMKRLKKKKVERLQYLLDLKHQSSPQPNADLLKISGSDNSSPSVNCLIIV